MGKHFLSDINTIIISKNFLSKKKCATQIYRQFSTFFFFVTLIVKYSKVFALNTDYKCPIIYFCKMKKNKKITTTNSRNNVCNLKKLHLKILQKFLNG